MVGVVGIEGIGLRFLEGVVGGKEGKIGLGN